MDGDGLHNDSKVEGTVNNAPSEEEVRENDENRPLVELFVKASVDKYHNGGCPMCHRYFMLFYLLREHGFIDLVVTTFLPESPPKEVLEISNGKRFPLLKVHKGIDSNGRNVADLNGGQDEIELFVARFDCDEMRDRRQSAAEAAAEKCSENLYNKFMQFLKSATNNPAVLIKNLELVDAHLRENGTDFMVGDTLSRADGYLIPTLQHIRVAGRVIMGFEIPTELAFLWRYLKRVYETPAFTASCPADREIVIHYDSKLGSDKQILIQQSKLTGEQRTVSTPSEVELEADEPSEDEAAPAPAADAEDAQQ